MPSLQAARDSNSTYSSSYIPTIVVVGGTSGIGEAISREFVKYAKGRAHLVIVGRNKAAAEATFALLPKASPEESQYEFVSCDVTVMKSIHQMCDGLKARLEKINYLILSAGVFAFTGREDTVDGLDVKMTSRYYSRFALLQDLLPLLKAAKAKGEAASAMSIQGAGQTTAIDWDDLGLNKKYTGMTAMSHSATYNDLMIQGFAERNPDIAFTHIYPGFVDSPMVRPKSTVGKLFNPIMRPLVWALATKPKDCAEYMIYAFLNAEKGMYRRNKKADDIGSYNLVDATEEQKKLFWEHSVESVKGKA